MGYDLTIKVGGAAGQGIQTVGTLLARTCRAAGAHVMGINDFESRVRGGHSFFQLRLSDQPVAAPGHRVDILLALDEKSVYLHREELTEQGLILMNTAREREGICAVPFVDIAKEAGDKLYANTVAAAAALAILGTPFDLVSDLLARQFSERKQPVIDGNIEAARLGFKAVEKISFPLAPLAETTAPKGQIMEGARALALGALAADCRVASFYPMSPATGIMAHLAGLISAAMDYKGFSVVDILQPCVSFNSLNTAAWYKERVREEDNPDPKDRGRAVDLAATFGETIPIGIFLNSPKAPFTSRIKSLEQGPLVSRAYAPEPVAELLKL